MRSGEWELIDSVGFYPKAVRRKLFWESFEIYGKKAFGDPVFSDGALALDEEVIDRFG